MEIRKAVAVGCAALAVGVGGWAALTGVAPVAVGALFLASGATFVAVRPTAGRVPQVADRTGRAGAGAGGVANTGVIGQLNLRTGAPVRTRYREQVELIAPAELTDRATELAELARFCTAPEFAGRYIWYRAPAWCGKSALMSTFALAPPPGVHVLPFFVTARWPAQGDRGAFVDNVLEQLVTLLGEEMPPFLRPSTREAHFHGLLADAVVACERRGEQLVLLVDGLDEDRGVTTGPDSHSVAALLPPRPPAGLRVIVSGRLNPPLPGDVPPDHPLRDPAVVRTLAMSPAATTARNEMGRELKRLLAGTTVEQDLLGLLTAGGGGLAVTDLAELIGTDVGDHLDSVAGRTFDRRRSRWGGDHEVIVLGHEELQVDARRLLGSARLAGYRARLTSWAAGYRDRRWPPDTPEYLLSGYHRMLRDLGDTDPMVALAIDPHRQQRLLTRSGGDLAAITEIVAVQDMLVDAEEPDLVALARLALHRDHLVYRNTEIPPELPALWAALGEPDRGETMASSILSQHDQVAALTAMVTAVADPEHARVLAGRAEQILTTVYFWQELCLDLVRALLDIGETAWAREFAMTTTDFTWTAADSIARAGLLVLLVSRGVTDTEIVEQLDAAARRLREQADFVLSARQPYQRSQQVPRLVGALVACAEALVALGAHDEARATAAEVASVATDAGSAELAAPVVRARLAVGDLAGARATADAVTSPHHQVIAMAELVGHTPLDTADVVARLRAGTGVLGSSEAVELCRALCRLGEHGFAEELARAAPTATLRARLLATIAATTGRRDRALVAEIEALSRSDEEPFPARHSRVELVETLIATGDRRLAERLVDTDPHWDTSDRGHLALIRAYLADGDLAAAQERARSIEWGPNAQEAFEIVVSALAGTGNPAARHSYVASRTDLDAATRLAAEVYLRGVEGGWAAVSDAVSAAATEHDQDVALAAALRAILERDEVDEAETVLARIHDEQEASRATELLVGWLVEHGELSRAETHVARLSDTHLDIPLSMLVAALADAGAADRAVALLRPWRDDKYRHQLLITTLVRTGAVDDAERIVAWLRPADRASATVVLVEELASHDVERAGAMAREIAEPEERTRALAAVAVALAGRGEFDRAVSLAVSLAPDHAADDEHSYDYRSVLDRTHDMPAWARALALISVAVAAAGDLRRAEAIVHGIPHLHVRIDALLRLTRETGAPRPVAHVLRAYGWARPLTTLTTTHPEVVAAIADEVRILNGWH